MTLPIYTPEDRRRIADALNVDEQYLYQLCKGIRIASAPLARAWNKADPKASLSDIRPDDWHLIWPELAKKRKQEA